MVWYGGLVAWWYQGLAGGIRRAQFPTQLYLFASWGVGALGGHQTDIFITSKHKYTNTKQIQIQTQIQIQ